MVRLPLWCRINFALDPTCYRLQERRILQIPIHGHFSASRHGAGSHLDPLSILAALPNPPESCQYLGESIWTGPESAPVFRGNHVGGLLVVSGVVVRWPN